MPMSRRRFSVRTSNAAPTLVTSRSWLTSAPTRDFPTHVAGFRERARASRCSKAGGGLRGFGVRTVPNLLFGGRVLVPGTVNVATYVHALDQALFPVSDAEAKATPTLH